ncbi:MAG: hypothetical protein ACLFV7_12970 [Phycisphaerae bacterium]
MDRPGGDRDSGAFEQSVKKLTQRMFPDEVLGAMSRMQPHIKGIDRLVYRNAFGAIRKADGPKLQCLLVNQRPGVTYSRYDITCGLLGNPNLKVSGLGGRQRVPAVQPHGHRGRRRERRGQVSPPPVSSGRFVT